MSDLSLSSNNLTFMDNSKIVFTGLCDVRDTSKVDISMSRMFTEEIINDFIILPNEQAPIHQITKVDVKNTILNYKVLESPGSDTEAFVKNNGNKNVTGKILSVSGVVCLDITYIPTDTAVNSEIIFNGKLAFTSYIVAPKTTLLTDKFDVVCCVQRINIISIEHFNINLSASFTLGAKSNQNPDEVIPNGCSCSSSDPLIINGVTPGNILKNVITSQDKIWNQVSFSRNIILPNNLLNAKSVTLISSSIKVISQKVILAPPLNPPVKNYYGEILLGKKLAIETVLAQKIVYIADNPQNTKHSLIINLPFSCYIIIPDEIALDQKYKINAYIEDLYSCCLNERTLLSGAILFFKAKEIKSCVSICPKASSCSCLNNFNIKYNINNLCDLRKIPLIPIRGTWSKIAIYRRVDLSTNNMVKSIESVSVTLKIISINLISTPTSRNAESAEGFTLNGLVCVVDGYLVTNIAYISKNAIGSVITRDVYIPFSLFAAMIEEPIPNRSKLVVDACLEDFFINILDDNGIGVYAKLFTLLSIVRFTP